MQLKGEISRCKRKLKESQLESINLRRELDNYKSAEIKAMQQQQQNKKIKEESEKGNNSVSTCSTSEEIKTEDKVKDEPVAEDEVVIKYHA